MTEADLHYDLACAEDLRATLVDLCGRHSSHRDDLVEFARELAAIELRAAVYPEPEPELVDEAVAARALARFYELEARLVSRSQSLSTRTVPTNPVREPSEKAKAPAFRPGL